MPSAHHPGSFLPAPETLVRGRPLFHLELAQDRVPPDVDLVPLRFQAAHGSLAHLAQVAQRGRVADQRVDLLARRRLHLHRGVDQLQLLHDDALDLEKMVVIRRAELLGARQADELVELFPALDVRLDLRDELVDVLWAHDCAWGLWVGNKAVWGSKKMIAPPRNSRAVTRRLPKCRLTSASGDCAARASLSNSSTSCAMPLSSFFEAADDTVEVTMLPFRSTVIVPVGNCCTAARPPNNFFRIPMTRLIYGFFQRYCRRPLSASRPGTPGRHGS